MDQRYSVSRPRVHWIAIAPCGFGHRNSRIRTAFWMDLFGGSCSHLLRNARLGRGSAVSCPSGQATRFASIGGPRRPPGFGRRVFLPGTNSARPRADLFGGRQTVGPESGSSSSRTRSNNPFIGSSSELLGLAQRVGRSKANLLSSCVNRGRTLRGATACDVAPSCPSGRTCPRPTCPPRVRRTTAGAIFGWQWQRPRTLDPGATVQCSRRLRVATAAAPSVQPGATVQCSRHLRVATAAAPSTQPGAADTGSLSFGRAKPG